MNWKVRRIGELVELQQGLCINAKSKHLLSDSGYPLLRITDLINDTEVQYINKNKIQNKFLTVPKDIIYTRTGQVGLVFKGKTGVLHNNCFTITPNSELNYNYLYWFLKSSYAYSYANAVAAGAAQPDLGHGPFKSMYIQYPINIESQEKISAILSAYDDLIENNKRRIALLEKMAEEIYREWFVRFRFPGYQITKFEKGIPKGWDECKLEDFCDVVTDGTHDTPKPVSDGYYLVTGKNIKNSKVNFEGAYFISEADHNEISKRSGLKEGDILYSNIGTIGQTAIVGKFTSYSVKNVIIFRPKDTASTYFLFQTLKNVAIAEQLILMSSGASQQFIGLGTARAFKILQPIQNIIDEFGAKTHSIFQNIERLLQINNNLIQTKNMLLPRLISGKLSVENIEIAFPPSMQENAETIS